MQLDGLRALAVTLVMAFHFIPGIDRIAPLGSIGVRLFFVISGFLITRMLVTARLEPRGDALRVFYLRRSLRIFPLFYLVLALAAMINIGPVRGTFGWHVSYLTNAYLFDRGAWHGSISHLWSLAVEEQFYLLWPFIVWWVPERQLPRVITAMICLAPLSRLAVGGPMSSVLPTSCLDSLGAGALLALPSTRHAITTAGRTLGAASLGGALALRYAGNMSVPVEVTLDFGVALTSAWLVGATARGMGGRVGAALERPAVVYVGTISYGLYLFHGFMPYVLGRYVPGFVDMPWPVQFVLLTGATLAVASISWRWFELPLLKVKERVYSKRYMTFASTRPRAA